MKDVDRVVDRYLDRHAERDGVGWAATVAEAWSHAVVIPVFDEAPGCLQSVLGRLPRGTLGIAVLNATDAAADRVHHNHVAFIEALRTSAGLTDCAAGLGRGRVGGVDLVVIRRDLPGTRFPTGQGVGLARKIGCDLALALWRAGWVRSPWIHTTDADAVLPEDYLTAAEQAPATAAAIVHPFWHRRDPTDEADAIGLYELSLRYYVAGLRWARSPYAFHTIGSCIAVRAETYAAVRGFPRRQAGEDFYALAKLAKLGDVIRPAGAPIVLSGRPSSRVPFGTGPAVRRLLACDGALTLYDPRSFAVLAGLWSAALRFADRSDDAPRPPADELTTAVAEALGFTDGLSRAVAGAPSPAARRRRVSEWFDAFRTLKVIHGCRDHGLAEVPWRDAVAQAGFLPDSLARASVTEIRQALADLDATATAYTRPPLRTTPEPARGR